MKACVVDASVAVKWYIPEAHHESALALLTLQRRGDVRLHVPDLFLSETANILWKKFRSGELDLRQTGEIASALRAVPKTVHSAEVLPPGCSGPGMRHEQDGIRLPVPDAGRLVGV